ncbi:MAG: hypothetical protein U0790_22315 [Isosphaeraceae bacterium]
MLTTRAPFALVAIAALGMAGWMAPRQGQTEGPAPPEGASEAPGADAKQAGFVLLADGRLVKGTISEEDDMLVVSQPIGAMRFPKKRVERIFPTIRKVYEYKLEQLPDNDSDERIKLARWCLAQNMEPEAREQLDAILNRSPKHLQARAMVASLDQAHERRSGRRQDPEVQQTAGEKVAGAPEGRPGLLDAAVFAGARRGMGLSEMPVVFDLPPAQAVRRTDEFVRYVHPVVQAYCARCHNDRYEGSFQLVQIKTKVDLTRDALKTNLDSCLRLIDRENPARSELLASSLRPHGRGPVKRPIFQGSNDRAYQILATWVNKLQAPKSPEVGRPHQGDPADDGDRFASARGRARGDQDGPPTPTQRFVTGPVETKVLPPARYEPGKGLVPDTSNDPDEFPLPLATGGKGPRASGAAQAGSSPAIPPASKTGQTDPGIRPASLPEIPPLPETDGAEAKAPATVPADDPSTAPAAADKKKPRKPLKIDPSLLQKALQLKNQGR